MSIAFIGGGVMAEAIIGGVLSAGLYPPDAIRVGEPVAARREYLARTHGVSAFSDNADAAAGADIALIAVKPQSLPEVLPPLGECLTPAQTAVSIVAGADMATLSGGLSHAAVIRVMPNTPAQIGEAMSVWTASAAVSPEARARTADILRTLGQEAYAPDEKIIDMATALSASGPAYVFLFIEALIDAGVHLGMARDMARRLALQTIIGSAKLVAQSGRHPADLKDMVTSPGGTTIAALRAMESGGFRAAVFDAVAAAHDRSQQLGKPSKGDAK